MNKPSNSPSNPGPPLKPETLKHQAFMDPAFFSSKNRSIMRRQNKPSKKNKR